MTVHLSPDGRELDALVASLRPGRFLLGIAGAPGAGKSTLAAAVAARTDGVVVPLDGFHLADAELDRRGLRDRKGAPDTFDAWGYAALLARLRTHPDHVVMAPGFERELEQPLAGAVAVPPSTGLVIAEGNYLLLDTPEWSAVRAELDSVWHVRTFAQVRIARLIARHVAFGKTPQEAHAWVTRVDEPNAREAETAGSRAGVRLDLTSWAG